MKNFVCFGLFLAMMFSLVLVYSPLIIKGISNMTCLLNLFLHGFYLYLNSQVTYLTGILIKYNNCLLSSLGSSHKVSFLDEFYFDSRLSCLIECIKCFNSN